MPQNRVPPLTEAPSPSRQAFASCSGNLVRIAATVVIGLSLSACGGAPSRTTFDLTAPADVAGSGIGRGQLVVNEPTTVQALDSDRILIREASGAIAYLPDVQWADRLPRLVQARLIQTFENASRLGRVSRPGDRIVPDLALNLDIRSFGIDAATSEAVVELTARLISDRTGRVVSARAVKVRRPASTSGPAAAQALNEALSQALREVVRWGGRG